MSNYLVAVDLRSYSRRHGWGTERCTKERKYEDLGMHALHTLMLILPHPCRLVCVGKRMLGCGCIVAHIKLVGIYFNFVVDSISFGLSSIYIHVYGVFTLHELQILKS